MSSTLMKVAVAYLVGVATILLYEEMKDVKDTDAIRHEIEADSGKTISGATDSLGCACDDTKRVVPTPESAENIPIKTVPECQKIVRDGLPPPPAGAKVSDAVRGAWISKETLDLIFCHMPDANGVFVYKGKNEGDPSEDVFVIEGGRTNRTRSVDDGSATMYYSRSVCPMICGECGM